MISMYYSTLHALPMEQLGGCRAIAAQECCPFVDDAVILQYSVTY